MRFGKPGATIDAPSLTHAAALPVVHGCVTINCHDTFARVEVHAGVGCVFDCAGSK